MSEDFDLDAYLARVGYDGPREPSLAVLSALHARQVDAIPFETMTPLLHQPVVLDLASLQAKMVARVRWRMPPEQPDGALNHMTLRVDLDDGPWLADVGFGGHTFAAPIRLTPDAEQTVHASTLRLVPHGAALTLQTRLADGWRDLYRFRDEAQSAADYQVYNWHTSAYPSSMFRSYLIAERLTPERRISLINSKLTERFADGRVVEQAVETPGALMRVLTEELGVEPPVDAETLFARLPIE